MADVYETRSSNEADKRVISTEDARQGETSGHVRVILASSLALALLAWLIIELVF
jgi:hypothetical protein